MDQHLTFSKEELGLLSNEQLFILKSGISKKLSDLLLLLSEEINQTLSCFENILPEEVLSSRPKISKGENYRGFPWIVLDHPRVFLQEDVYAFRSLCWWGHEFSFTLHLGGKFLNSYREQLPAILTEINAAKIYFCISDSPWNYYFEKDNYLLLPQLLEQHHSIENWIAERTFIKISKKTELKDYSLIPKEGSSFLRSVLDKL